MESSKVFVSVGNVFSVMHYNIYKSWGNSNFSCLSHGNRPDRT